MTSPQRLGRLVVALLVLGAALFATESGEQAGHDDAAEGHSETSTEHAVESSETVLGLDVESPGLVALGVVVSLVLAGLAWLRPRRVLFIVVTAFAAAFAVFDVAEMLHQIDRSKTDHAVLAAVVALIHLLAALASAVGAASAPSDARPVAPLGLS